MSMAAERSRAAPGEPDRLDGFSTPREVDRLFGHEAAIERIRRRARKAAACIMPGCWSDRRASARRRSPIASRARCSPRARELRRRETIRCSARWRRSRIPNLLLIRRSWVEKSKRYSQWIGVDEVRRLTRLSRQYGGRGGLARRHRRPRRRAEPECGERASEGAGRAAVQDAVPPDLERRGAASRHHPLAHPDASCHGLGREDLEEAVRAALDRDEPRGRRQDARHRARALSQGSVRRALELVVERRHRALWRDRSQPSPPCRSIDGPRLHRLVERLAGAADTERFDLYLALLLGLIERLIRVTATGEGATQEEQKLAKRLISPANLADWADAWEAISEAKARGLRPQSRSRPACCSRPGSGCSIWRGNILFSEREPASLPAARRRRYSCRHGRQAALLHHHRHLLSERRAPYRPCL